MKKHYYNPITTLFSSKYGSLYKYAGKQSKENASWFPEAETRTIDGYFGDNVTFLKNTPVVSV